ncbi:hypothetical protein F5X68DRAFT_241037 [Plectosphaerella plurivora]|uniref:3-keto-alpha-glucoside-1,2-lyase/3-keto-2-hydroxy-glucal hydratase domain-containing protein n=1 Tax=Plectosphaerella plurivora TaxID=936078 RepID=A0A9P8V9L3_9PEZI|nr:hypothetical protein F5X68DRAFT_241037 [Plectosphaerella plurivora]
MIIETFSEDGFKPLFDSKTTAGWRPVPRIYSYLYPGGEHIDDVLKRLNVGVPPNPEIFPAKWSMEDGVLIGEQATRRYGGYLVSEQSFGEFELAFDANPDWPADTGIMIRRNRDSMEGIQVLLDHRKSGNIGGFFGNCLGSFHGVNFGLDVDRDEHGNPIGLKLEDPATSAEPLTPEKKALLSYSCNPKDFISVWKWADWNSFRIRCVGGPLPTVTTWVNGLKIAEIDLATMSWPNFNHKDVADVLGPAGHIAFEVHDNDDRLGDDRWGEGAQCRWRNVRLKQL